MRDRLIDATKGIAIILVIVFHCGGLYYGAEITNFVLQAFFVCSGILFAKKKDEAKGIGKYLWRKVKGILLPYYLVGGINYIFFYFAYPLHFKTLREHLIYLWPGLIGKGEVDSYYFTGTLWFLTILFSTSVVFYFIVKFVKPLHARVMIFGAILVLGALFPTGKILPFRVDLLVFTLPYMELGYELGRSSRYDEYRSKKVSILLIGVSFSILCIATKAFELYTSWYSHIVPSKTILCFVVGMFGTLLCFETAKALEVLDFPRHFAQNVVEWIGRNSIIFLIVHQHYVLFVLNKCELFSGGRTRDQLIRLIICILVCSLVTLGYDWTKNKISSLRGRK